MNPLYEVRAAQYEYERRLRAAEHYRQVKRMENAGGEGLAKRVAKVAALLVTLLGMK